MDKISIERKYVLEYIKDTLNEAKVNSKNITDAKYHHCSRYQDAASILRYGILSMEDIKQLGIKDYTKETMTLMKDIESHINGTNSISLSVAGLDDLYPNEDEYNPFSPEGVDFCIDSSIPVRRSTLHYGNEFLAKGSIQLDKIKSADIRLLEYINKLENSSVYTFEKALKKYNCIKYIALAIKESKKAIYLREMSKDNICLDIYKVSSFPKLSLK